MINYSTFMWKSPLDDKAPEMAYAKNQVTKVMSFDEFVKHISDHNGVFTRGTVKGVVSDTCSCLVEQLLNGNKVQFGELGIFSISITCDPAPSLKEFTADNIKVVNLLFTPGADFENLRSKAEFNLVASRAVQNASIKALKEGADVVNLAALRSSSSNPSPEEPTDPDNTPTGGGSDNTGGSEDSGTDTGGSTGGSGEEDTPPFS
ncbi:DNA-binding protein [Parabacteroides distasonis]|nr:DNA-binding protein [Parabacteroides distasonis]